MDCVSVAARPAAVTAARALAILRFIDLEGRPSKSVPFSACMARDASAFDISRNRSRAGDRCRDR